MTLLHFPDNVSEVFKVLDGRIILIDNLPLWLTGIEPLGFLWNETATCMI